MREYAKFQPRYWTSGPGKKYRGDPDAQLVGAYLFTAPTSNMLGIFYLPKSTIAHDLGLSQEGASKALRTLSEGAFCSYDDETEMIWVHEMARIQVLDKEKPLKPKDKRVKGIRRELLKHQDCVHFQAFISRYRDDLLLENLDIKKQKQAPPEPLPKIGNSDPKPLRSKEREQEQEQERGGEKGDPPQSANKQIKAFDVWKQWESIAGGPQGDFSYQLKHCESVASTCNQFSDPVKVLVKAITSYRKVKKKPKICFFAADIGDHLPKSTKPHKQPPTPEESYLASQAANEK